MKPALVAAWYLTLAATLPAQPAPQGLPRVLILGDQLYNEPARAVGHMLVGRAQVSFPKERPGDTGTALERLDTLLGDDPWDLIHFNFGFADLHYKAPGIKAIRAMSEKAGGVRVTSPTDYEANLHRIVQRLKETGAKLVWASTTPIHSSQFDGLYRPGSEIEYNAIAARVMRRHDVAINDMHGYVRATAKDKRDRSPFGYKGYPLHPPIAKAILQRLGLLKPLRRPLKVFVMVGGWSHIGGGVVRGGDRPRPGRKGSLDDLVTDPSTAQAYAGLVGPDGRWVHRPDVWIRFDRRFVKSGVLGVGYGGDRQRGIGPELMFGHVLGDHLDQQVYVIKTAIGAPSLAKELRPPSSGSTGKAYTRLVAHLDASVTDIAQRFPDFTDASTFELAGLVLNLGEQDTDPVIYRTNLQHLIDDLRRHLKSPALPVVLVGTGKGGFDAPAHPEIIEAQQSIARSPRYRDTLSFVETRAFWPPEVARGAARHPSADRWYDNAESFCRMGAATGEAMLGLLGRPGSKDR